MDRPRHFYVTRGGQRRRVTPFTVPNPTKGGKRLKRYRLADGTVLQRTSREWLVDANGVRWLVCGE